MTFKLFLIKISTSTYFSPRRAFSGGAEARTEQRKHTGPILRLEVVQTTRLTFNNVVI